VDVTPDERPENSGAQGATPSPSRLRVCVVKQNTTYDLYTRTGPDLRTMVASSNWRAGPLGLWEAFDCECRIVYESPDPECQLGKRQWGQYVEGWDIWPEGSTAERADDVDWSRYDMVVSIDVAVPTQIVRQHRRTMWCYYFIEGGTSAAETTFRGSPYFGYNVFFNHRHATTLLGHSSPVVRRMRREKRAMLDFPYYMMSSMTLRRIYSVSDEREKRGVMMSSHSLKAISPEERRRLELLCPINERGEGVANVHLDALASEYCVVHPDTRPITGLALVEAISAGCIALAPRRLVVGFPNLIPDDIDYEDFSELLRVIQRLQNDPGLRLRTVQYQSAYVDRYLFDNPTANLETILRAFRDSNASARRQCRAEQRDKVLSDAMNLATKAKGRASRELVRPRFRHPKQPHSPR